MFELIENKYADKTQDQLIREQRERIQRISKVNFVINNRKLFNTGMTSLNRTTLNKIPMATVSEKL